MTASFEKPAITLVDDRDMAQEVDPEKRGAVYTIDDIRVVGISDEDAAFYQSYTPEMRKRVIRKVRDTFHSLRV
jgi:hypothetical protein